MCVRVALILACSFLAPFAQALQLQTVAPNVYALIGELGNRTPTNLGNNANFVFVVTTKGVVLIDSGGSYQGAKRIHQHILTLTQQPIVKVINTGGQDHRWLGNAYFKRLGADIIATEIAVSDQRQRFEQQLYRLNALIGAAALAQTDAVYADVRFSGQYRFTLGGIDFVIQQAPAHTPGDAFVWLPQSQVMVSGDIVYTKRLLGILPVSNSRQWLQSYLTMAAFQPVKIVPGHGPISSEAQTRRETYDYLVSLRQAVAAWIDAGNDISDIAQIQQQPFRHLLNFDSLAIRNAQQVYSEMEWE